MKRYSSLCVSMVEKLGRLSLRLVATSLLLLGLLPVATGVSHANEPLSLTDSQLDGITAGFLELNATANAVALGQDSLTTTFTDTLVIQGVPQADGYVYSQGTALADALAIGESVTTGTSVGFVTDEEVVSVQYENLVETSIVGYAKPKDKKAWKQKKKSRVKKDKKAWNQKKTARDKKAWNQKKTKKDNKAWNQNKQKKDKKAWNQNKQQRKNQGKKVAKNDPDKKAWHKKNRKQTRNVGRKNDPDKKAWHKKGHKKGHKNSRKNDPNKKAWRKIPIIQQREVSTLVVTTRVAIVPAVAAAPAPVVTPAAVQ